MELITIKSKDEASLCLDLKCGEFHLRISFICHDSRRLLIQTGIRTWAGLPNTLQTQLFKIQYTIYFLACGHKPCKSNDGNGGTNSGKRRSYQDSLSP